MVNSGKGTEIHKFSDCQKVPASSGIKDSSRLVGGRGSIGGIRNSQLVWGPDLDWYKPETRSLYQPKGHDLL
ncbi:hypothetical protein PM082_010027 [Marasmius tenuissimus]|nr:hypothetical protein PM082_010027 [Marasmius tenuissimus]